MELPPPRPTSQYFQMSNNISAEITTQCFKLPPKSVWNSPTHFFFWVIFFLEELFAHQAFIICKIFCRNYFGRSPFAKKICNEELFPTFPVGNFLVYPHLQHSMQEIFCTEELYCLSPEIFPPTQERKLTKYQ